MKQSNKKKNSKKRKKKSQVVRKNTKKKVNSKNRKKNNTVKKKTSSSKNKNVTQKNKEEIKVESPKPKDIKKNKDEKIKDKLNHFKELIKKTNNKLQQKKIKKKQLKEEKKLLKTPKKKQKSSYKKEIFIKRLSPKTIRNFILISILCLIFAILLMYPFGITNYKSEASGKILDIPKLSILNEECCMYNASFTTFRSFSSLKLELETILDSYEKLNCDGKDYFYNKEEDFTVTDYGIKKGFIFSEFFFTYDKGNSCEIDTTLKNIELLSDNYSLEDAKRDGCYVIDDNQEFNISSYNKFLEEIEANITSTLRFVTTTQNGDIIITDLKYMSDGRFKVIYDGTRDRENPEDNRVMMAYVYEHIGIYKDKLYAYNGNSITNSMLETNDVYYLFDMIE